MEAHLPFGTTKNTDNVLFASVLFGVEFTVKFGYEVVRRKKPILISSLDRFFEALPFEMVHTPQVLPKHDWFTIRDSADEKVLYSAISSDVDILITGDKDFDDIAIEKPDILTPRQFTEKYIFM